MSAASSQSDVTFGIRDWFAWKPGRETRAAWRSTSAGAITSPDAQSENNPISTPPMMLRRRMSGFGQKVVGAAMMAQSTRQARYVFASRHGEFATTLRLLEDLYNRSMPSPADFSMSVHHALAGLLSIQTGNKAGHTTISAGRDTFGYGLLEAVTSVLEGPDQSTLLVSYDEPLPAMYGKFQQADEGNLPLVVVFDIVSAACAGCQFSLSIESTENAAVKEADLEIPMGQRFLDYYLSDRPNLRLGGDSQTWVFHRVT
jgi:hypothetical protein